jgi:CheY-like chemotaxis protein
MVYGFAKQSGGHVKIYSEIGRGTTIKLYLPQSGDRIAAAPASAPTHVMRGARGKETILVIEDDPGLRHMAVRMMEGLGYKTRQAQDPVEALAALEAHSDVNLVFSDIVMPGEMTGITLAERIRAMRPDVRILLTTGYSETFVRNENDDLGGAGFLAKPYRRQDLAAKVRQMLDEPVSS